MKKEAKEILLDGQVITYVLRRNPRARQMGITIQDETGFIVTKPTRASMVDIEKFIYDHRGWIIKQLEKHRQAGTSINRGTRKDYLAYKQTAKQLAEQRLKHFNQYYGFKYHKVSVRDQSSRWGSCTRKGNLSFNYRILFLPSDMADYIVVHELCHLKEMNHSARFWALVKMTIPGYLGIRRRLRNHSVKVL